MQRVLVAQGLEPELVAGLVAEAATHVAPFVDGGVEEAVRRTLARRLAGAPPTRPDPLVLAVVGGAGAGKTTCATRLASAYAARSDVQVIRLALGEAAPGFTAVDAEGAVAEAAAATRGTVVVLDTPPVSASDAEGAAALTAALHAAGANEAHVVLPATLSTPAARAALAAVAGLGPVAAILTHLDGTEHPGPALGAVLTAGLPISYVAAGNPKDAFGLRAADHDALATGLLA